MIQQTEKCRTKAISRREWSNKTKSTLLNLQEVLSPRNYFHKYFSHGNPNLEREKRILSILAPTRSHRWRLGLAVCADMIKTLTSASPCQTPQDPFICSNLWEEAVFLTMEGSVPASQWGMYQPVKYAPYSVNTVCMEREPPLVLSSGWIIKTTLDRLTGKN